MSLLAQREFGAWAALAILAGLRLALLVRSGETLATRAP